MKYSAIIVALATATASLAAPNDTVYETITTTAITTYCPYPTKIVHGSMTYTVTEAMTLTITDCPCTVTKPVIPHPTASTVLYTSCPPETPTEKVTAYPEGPKTTGPAYSNPLTAVYPGGTATDKEGAPAGTVSYTPTTATHPPQYTGAASANTVGSLVVGAAALVALVL